MTTDTVHKPIVTYQPREDDYIEVGKRAFIRPVDQREVLTSRVLCSLNIDGVLCFETENTIYRPVHHA